MRWKPKILLPFLILFTLTITFIYQGKSSTSQTHTLDTSTFHFKLDNDCRILFDASIIYLGDSNGLWSWIDTDGIEFNNLMMGDGNSQALLLSIENSDIDANITVTKLFKDSQFEATISASLGTTTLQLSDVDRPLEVTIDDTPANWGYDPTTKTLTVTNDHASTHILLIAWAVSESSAIGLAIIALTFALCALIFATKKRRDLPTDMGGL